MTVGTGTNALVVGPKFSGVLSDDLCWNLAWLSWPYEVQPQPENSGFTVAISQTMAMRLGRYTMRQLMAMPPEFFAERLLDADVDYVKTMPLYKMFGDLWPMRVQERARWRDPHDPVYDFPTGVEDARALLDRLWRPPA